MKTLESKKFRTRQEFISPMTNPKGKDYILGIDIGYSGTKVFHENGCFCFPSYAKKIESDTLMDSDKDDILYRDDRTGDIYIVGRNAQKLVEAADTNDTDGELYSRKRYSDTRFRIVCDVAVALAVMHKKDRRQIVIQTGLPTSYLKADAHALQQVFARERSFSLKVGNGAWMSFAPEISAGNVHVMAQPTGALYSVLIGKDGKPAPNAKNILSDNTLVLDIGFGTFDFYGIKNRAIECTDTINDIGMHAVMEEVSKRIMSEYGEDVRVAALQNILEEGVVECFNEDEMRSEAKPIAPILEAASREVMQTAFQRVKSVTNSFRGYHYIIVDGGTGEAWYNSIREWLKNMSTLTVIPSNVNDHLSFIYSNARGYYMFCRQQNIR